ncbi:MAG: histidine--tRNA ligase [Leptospiraceae bacterium]|nr:histidine--tRNA ligase [Leptospiraceae bacterium]MCZ8347329.1 histidine--tRNA ligase [Leptospiraceae bacterium]
MKEKKEQLTTAGYKGTRDFYPDQMRIRNYMFNVMRSVVESYGYEEYDGPMIESLDLYRAKTGDEIVGKQIYDFIDKGGREVAIRPEMTPTLARMVAGKLRELPRPIRWFSFPNLWRYEQPGHGRLREHWQLNVDIFGVDSNSAELEILKLACDILTAFGANKSMFQVKISHRKILDGFFQGMNLDPSKAQEVSKILDKKNKITHDEYLAEIKKTIPNLPDADKSIDAFLNSSLVTLEQIPGISSELIDEIKGFFAKIDKIGLGDIVQFDPSIIRGFDYYTGYIFEIYDSSPKNKRSLYGGGRYDNLIGLFTNDAVSGTGFGLGDVTLQNFLETHDLLPSLGREDIICIPILSEEITAEIFLMADEIRKSGLKCEMFLNPDQKFGKQISLAEKKGFKHILICGPDELTKGIISLKNLELRTQIEIPRSELVIRLLQEFNGKKI